MGKNKKSTRRNGPKLQSRQRNEDKRPPISFRVDKETKRRLKEHLKGTSHSFADFVKDALGREDSMIQKRIETLASRQANGSLEERIRSLENFVHEIFSITVDHNKYPPFCPRCDGQEMLECEGRDVESKSKHPTVMTWKCPKCGYFIDTYKRIDPESLRWSKPYRRSARHRLKGPK